MKYSAAPNDLSQINRDVIKALEKNGIKDSAVVVSFTEPSTAYKRVFWVSNVARIDAIKMLKELIIKMISPLN